MTEGVLSFLSEGIDDFIVLFGVVLFVLIMINGSRLSFHKSRIKEAVGRVNKKYKVNPTDGTVIAEDDEDAAITPDTVRQYETEFSATCAWHSVITQLIPIFPLLGILGTVAGLMFRLNSEGIEAMMDSLNMALSSTLYGLIFAIILKLIDAVYPSRIIDDTEVLLEDYGKKLDIAEMIKTIRNNA